MTLAQHMNERAAMDCLADCADRLNMLVIHTDRDGVAHDVSQRFAEQLAIRMARAGFEAETIERYEFVRSRLTNDRVDEIVRGG